MAFSCLSSCGGGGGGAAGLVGEANEAVHGGSEGMGTSGGGPIGVSGPEALEPFALLFPVFLSAVTLFPRLDDLRRGDPLRCCVVSH